VEGVHAFGDADVDESVVDFFHEVVFFNDLRWNETNVHKHVLGILHGRVEVEVLDVAAAHAGAAIRESGIDQALERSCDVGSGGAGAVWILDEVASTNGEVGSFDFCLLGSFGADKTSVLGGGLVAGNFVVVNELDCVGTFDAATNTSGQAPEFVGTGS
jgi:hypothetical protein